MSVGGFRRLREVSSLYEKAIPFFDKAIALRPNFTEVCINDAALGHGGRNAEALDDCNSATKWKLSDAHV